MFLIVGLGNPEKKYDNTYHNVGFMAIDFIAEKLGVEFKKKDCQAVIAETSLNGEKLILAKPQTYMNLSGNSVLAFKTKYKISNDKILVLVDDIDLPLGTYRYKTGGSGGTHNGLRNIVFNIGTDFKRLRIGIGKPEDTPLIDFVLSKINKENLSVIKDVIAESSEVALNKIGE